MKLKPNTTQHDIIRGWNFQRERDKVVSARGKGKGKGKGGDLFRIDLSWFQGEVR